MPVTYLGVETSSVPTVVAEQLGLAKGFGLVVDYVVPDGPAAAAGLQANDILKMLNDQILLEPDQLSKLIRSYPEGTSVTLTVLRKGAETKLTAKLGKREVSQRRGLMPGFEKHWKSGDNFGGLGPDFEQQMKEFGEEMGRNGEEIGRHLREQMGDMQFGLVGDAVGSAREEIKRAREDARRAAEEGRRAADATRRDLQAVRERKSGNAVRVITSNDNGALKTTRIDLNKAQIVYSDAQGEMKIETVDNKKLLTAKDAQGRLLFSGPVETKEELDKLPVEVRQRYDKLEQKDIPAVVPTITQDDEDDADENDNDEDDNDADAAMREVSTKASQSFGAPRFPISNGTLI